MKNSTTLSGFTLVELLITIAIFSLLSTYILNSWSPWINEVRHRTLINSYAEIFNFARWMAASRRHLVTLCPLDQDNRCHDNWNLEVSVFPDRDNDKRPDDDIVWRVLQPPMAPFSVRSRTGGRGYLQFAETGLVHGASGGLVVCPALDAKGGKMSYIALNRGGRFRSEHDEDDDQHIELSWGTDIYCP